MGWSSLRSISWLCPQMFYPYVMTSTSQAHKSDDLRHAMSPFSLFLSSFLGAHRILGYVRPWRVIAVYTTKRGKRSGLHLEELSNSDSLRAGLWCNWPSNAASEGCRPWIESQQVIRNRVPALSITHLALLYWDLSTSVSPAAAPWTSSPTQTPPNNRWKLLNRITRV